jgi:hypothetical protein
MGTSANFSTEITDGENLDGFTVPVAEQTDRTTVQSVLKRHFPATDFGILLDHVVHDFFDSGNLFGRHPVVMAKIEP